MREFFPANMRFLYYVAKRYGYTFHNDEIVRKANFLASVTVTKMYTQGREFESNEHLYGYVMNAFKYAILSAYNVTKKESVDVRNESELTYGAGDDEYNVYVANAVSRDIEYDNTADKVYEELYKTLSPLDRQVLYLKYKEDFRNAEIQCRLELTDSEFRCSRERIKRKYKSTIKNIENDKSKKQDVKPVYISVERSKQRVQSLIQDRPNDKVNEKPKAILKGDEHSYNEAVSWIHSY